VPLIAPAETATGLIETESATPDASPEETLSPEESETDAGGVNPGIWILAGLGVTAAVAAGIAIPIRKRKG
jgi:hypothetical protein